MMVREKTDNRNNSMNEQKTHVLRTFAKNQPTYLFLPVALKGDGEVVLYRKLTWRERIKVLFYGQVGLRVLTDHKNLNFYNWSPLNR